MRVSIIVPVFNAEAFLGDCLISIQRQTMSDFEVLCVDDGSTDSSAEVIRAVAAQDPRFRLIMQENRGASSARNVGYDAAVGEVVTFIDADDEITADFLEELLQTLDDTDADFAIGNKLIRRGDVASPKTPELVDGVVNGADFGSHVLATHVAPHGKLYRRAFLQYHGIRFREGITYEDYIYWLLCLTKNPRVATTSSHVYTYKRNPDSISSVSRRLDPYNVRSRIIQTNECVQIAVDSGIAGLEERVFRKQFSSTLLRQVRFLSRSKDAKAVAAAFNELQEGLQPHRDRVNTLLKGWKRLAYLVVLGGTLEELVAVLRLVEGKTTRLQTVTVEEEGQTKRFLPSDQLPSLHDVVPAVLDVTDAFESRETQS